MGWAIASIAAMVLAFAIAILWGWFLESRTEPLHSEEAGSVISAPIAIEPDQASDDRSDSAAPSQPPEAPNENMTTIGDGLEGTPAELLELFEVVEVVSVASTTGPAQLVQLIIGVYRSELVARLKAEALRQRRSGDTSRDRRWIYVRNRKTRKIIVAIELSFGTHHMGVLDIPRRSNGH